MRATTRERDASAKAAKAADGKAVVEERAYRATVKQRDELRRYSLQFDRLTGALDAAR